MPSLHRFLQRRLPIVDQAREESETRRFISALDIRTRGPRERVRLLSGGNQQKVALAKWLCVGGDIYILDEPTKGVDIQTKIEFYRSLNELAKEGAAVILISTELEEIEGLCSRALVMREGAIVAELCGEHVTEANILRHCYDAESRTAA